MKRYSITGFASAGVLLAFGMACGVDDTTTRTPPPDTPSPQGSQSLPEMVRLPRLPTGPLPAVGAQEAQGSTSVLRSTWCRHHCHTRDAGPDATATPDAAIEAAAPDAGVFIDASEEAAVPDAVAEAGVFIDAGEVALEASVDAGGGADMGIGTDAGELNVVPSGSVELRALVLGATGQEPEFAALTGILGTLGTPYDAVVPTRDPFGAETLVDASGHGKYAAVFVATGGLPYWNADAGAWQSALSSDQWATLVAYERDFSVREVQYYAYPYEVLGLAPLAGGYDTTNSPVLASVTAAGAEWFSYVNRQAPIPVTGAWFYPASVSDPATTTVLIEGAGGEAMTIVHRFPDGREALVNMMDGNEYLVHSAAYAYGFVSWAFRGVFPGERQVYLSPQVDDVLLYGDLWAPDGTWGGTYRITDADLQAIERWQGEVNASLPQGSDFRLSMVFNGAGLAAGDPLTDAAIASGDRFWWVSHTLDHQDLDFAGYDTCYAEHQSNLQAATAFGLRAVPATSLVTPGYSGLANAACLQGLWDAGVRWVAGDTSRPGMKPSTPNVAIVDSQFQQLTIVPRHPTSLFYNVAKPEQWVGEYNQIYGAFFGRALDYQEILANERAIALHYLLSYDNNPLMFHQGNLATYDSAGYGTGTPIGDWINTVLAGYRQVLNLPVVSLSMDDIAARMLDRMAYNDCGARVSSFETATTRQLTVQSDKACTVPISGIARADVGRVEQYGGQPITWIPLVPGTPVTFTMQK